MGSGRNNKFEFSFNNNGNKLKWFNRMKVTRWSREFLNVTGCQSKI